MKYLDLLENPELPALNGLLEHLNSNFYFKDIWAFTKKIYHEYQNYNNEREIVSETEREQDIKNCIGLLKYKLIVLSKANFIEKLVTIQFQS